MKRRVFVSQSVKLISASFLIGGVTACKDEEVSSNEPDCEAAGTKSSIADNHGHTLSVSKRDVIEGRTKGYEIQGSSGHTHTVVLGSEEFASLQEGNSVSVTSSTDSGHSHIINVRCANA